LQLVDPLQDDWRPGNWAVLTNATTAAPQWQYVTLTGVATKSIFLIGLTAAGSVYLDDVKLVAGSVAEAGPNVLTNGDFESPLSGPWTVSPNMANSSISTNFAHSGNASLNVVATSGGPTIGEAIWQYTATLVTNATYTLSYWYLPRTDGNSSLLRLSGSTPTGGDIYSLQSYQPSGAALSLFTPGAPNSTRATLPPFPPLWINELQAENISGITNSADGRSPWVEIYNPGTNMVSLGGLLLSHNYANLGEWAFPTGASVNPGQFKLVFADGLTNLSTLAELHANFTLDPGTGSVALSRLYNGQAQPLDYVDYSGLAPDDSYGSFPDGQSFDRQEFAVPTPMAPNNAAAVLIPVAVNEWMASNTRTILDPLTGGYNDWFELYNYGTNVADLGGYYLGHSPANLQEFQIPHGYTIPPKGFLLVWADKTTGTSYAELHVNFHLAKSGTSIILSSPAGRTVDSVTFDSQTSDVSMGRYPDGSSNIVFLAVATPGFSNDDQNTAPSITPPGDQVVYLGQTLQIAIQASDTDIPPQPLTFSLGAGSPTNAVIDPVTGLFSWTPLVGQAPGTNLVTVSVSDNGTPPLSASQTFTVTVLLPPGLQPVGLAGQTLTVGWTGALGKTYRVQYKDDLTAPAWNRLGADQTGSGGPLSFNADLSQSPHRYFRILLVN
jgi:hypothetical protein